MRIGVKMTGKMLSSQISHDTCLWVIFSTKQGHRFEGE